MKPVATRVHVHLFVPALGVLAACFIARPALADWPALGRAITTAAGAQTGARIVSDGADGAIVVWHDARSARVNLFARRVLASGELDPAWPADGRALVSDSSALAATSGGQRFPVIASDGAGGAIVAWQEDRGLGTAEDIFAQHVLASGVVDPVWPANGRALCTATGIQDIPTIVSDGAGGAIVTWMDDRIGGSEVDIFAQHVLASGAVDPAWPVNGRALCSAPSPQAFPTIATDGSGGAIVTWYDFRPSTTGLDIYAQHVTSAGIVDPLWPVNGRALALATGTQQNPTIVSDGVHGAIVTWEDFRAGLQHIFAQRVTGSGAIAPGWPADGLAVCTADIDQTHPLITADGASGAIITWFDFRSGVSHNPYAQRVLAGGTTDPAWPVNGVALSLSSGEEVASSIVGDGAGGAIVAWEEDSFIFANHVTGSGARDPQFSVNGRFIRLLDTFQRSPDLVPSGAGQAIVAWDDRVQVGANDIYANLVVTTTTLAVEPGGVAPGVALAPPSPNPALGAVTLRFALPQAADVSLAIYDASGRRVRALAFGVASAGEHALAWDRRDEAGRPARAGLYFARLQVGDRVLTRKLAMLD